jgi:hypothetical protein
MRISIAMIGLVLAVLPAAAQPAPTATATEIFELRTKCQAMANEIAKPFLRHQQGDRSVGVTMKPPEGGEYVYKEQSKESERANQKFSVTAESNLNLTTLHCYALITLLEMYPSNYQKREKYIHLYDAQTKQTLAFIFDSEKTNDTLFGIAVTDKFFDQTPILNSWDVENNRKKIEEVTKYINEKMNPNR